MVGPSHLSSVGGVLVPSVVTSPREFFDFGGALGDEARIILKLAPLVLKQYTILVHIRWDTPPPRETVCTVFHLASKGATESVSCVIDCKGALALQYSSTEAAPTGWRPSFKPRGPSTVPVGATLVRGARHCKGTKRST